MFLDAAFLIMFSVAILVIGAVVGGAFVAGAKRPALMFRLLIAPPVAAIAAIQLPGLARAISHNQTASVGVLYAISAICLYLVLFPVTRFPVVRDGLPLLNKVAWFGNRRRRNQYRNEVELNVDGTFYQQALDHWRDQFGVTK